MQLHQTVGSMLQIALSTQYTTHCYYFFWSRVITGPSNGKERNRVLCRRTNHITISTFWATVYLCCNCAFITLQALLWCKVTFVLVKMIPHEPRRALSIQWYHWNGLGNACHSRLRLNGHCAAANTGGNNFPSLLKKGQPKNSSLCSTTLYLFVLKELYSIINSIT